MNNDGQCWVWVPTDISLSRLPQSGADRINAIHSQIGRPLVTVGQANPYKSLLTDIADTAADAVRDAEMWTDTSMSVWGPIANFQYIEVADIQLIVMAGGDVEGLPVWFEIDDITVACPFSTDDPQETWETWGTFGESHKPTQLGDKWYRSSAIGESGNLLHASQWVPLKLTNQIKVLTRKEILAIQTANQTTLP